MPDNASVCHAHRWGPSVREKQDERYTQDRPLHESYDHFRPYDHEQPTAGNSYAHREPNRDSCDRRGPMDMNSGDFGDFKPIDMEIPPDDGGFDQYEPPHSPVEFNHWESDHSRADFRLARFDERPRFRSDEHRRDDLHIHRPGNVEASLGPPSEQFERDFQPPYLRDNPKDHDRRYSPPPTSEYRDSRSSYQPAPPSPPPGLQEERRQRRYDQNSEYLVHGRREHTEDGEFDRRPLLGRCPEDLNGRPLLERFREDCNGSRDNDIYSRDVPR